MRRLRPTSRPSLRRRTRALQRKSTVIRHAPPTQTTSSSCLTQSLTSSLQITFEGAGCIRGGSCVVLQLTGSAVNLKQNPRGHDVTLKLSFDGECGEELRWLDVILLLLFVHWVILVFTLGFGVEKEAFEVCPCEVWIHAKVRDERLV